MAKKQALNPRKILERLRSTESPSALAADLGVRDAEVLTARELVRHIGEHQAQSVGRLPDPLAAALVEAAVQIEHADFLKAVAEGGSKSASSFARRGLSILKSRGIDVEVAPQGQPVFNPDAAKAEELSCLITTPDSRGERGLWIPRPQRGGGLTLISVFFSDLQGIVHAESADASRKAFRKVRDELLEKGGNSFATLEIPLSKAKAYVAAARAKTPAGLALTHETIVAALTADASAAEAEPQSKKDAPFDGPVEAQRVAEGADLHDEPEIRAWRGDDVTLRALALRLDEIMTSSLYIDEKQRQEQVDKELLAAADGFFTPERQKLYAARLFEVADALKSMNRTVAAERAAATARALDRGVNPVTNPFCRRMFEKIFPPVGRPMPQSAAPTTPGGLILPGGSPEPR